MLNVPATALSVAALYHARRWFDEPPNPPRHLYLAALWSVAAVLTYFIAGVLVIVLLAWLLVARRARLLMQPRTLIAGAVAAALLSPWAVLVWRVAPTHVSWATPSSATR